MKKDLDRVDKKFLHSLQFVCLDKNVRLRFQKQFPPLYSYLQLHMICDFMEKTPDQGRHPGASEV
jgi:hypothetical protein